MEHFIAAFGQVFELHVLLVIFFSSLYGLLVGSIPGLSATLAAALLVPVTFFMAPVPALAALVTAHALAILPGHVPGCLLRIPCLTPSLPSTHPPQKLPKKRQ